MNDSKYDLAVAYRIYSKTSSHPPPIFADDKLKLAGLCLDSFKASLGNLRVKIWVLLDNCPPAYQALVESLLPKIQVEFIPLKGEGNQATFVRQVNLLASQQMSDLVYFAEDDYLYLPGSLERAVNFLRHHTEADFLTLYDHADFHTKFIHRIHSCQYVDGDRTWRGVTSTCLTFMARRSALVETADVFKSYARRNSDVGLWMALTKYRVLNPWSFVRSLADGSFVSASHALAWWHTWRQILFGKRRLLVAPIPSLATHMEAGGLAPGVNWEKLWVHGGSTMQ